MDSPSPSAQDSARGGGAGHVTAIAHDHNLWKRVQCLTRTEYLETRWREYCVSAAGPSIDERPASILNMVGTHLMWQRWRSAGLFIPVVSRAG
jgi:hypothetical protein